MWIQSLSKYYSTHDECDDKESRPVDLILWFNHPAPPSIAWWYGRYVLYKGKADYSPAVYVIVSRLHITVTGIGTRSFKVSSPCGECSAFSGDTFDTVSIVVSLGIHYCWVTRDNVESKLAQALYNVHNPDCCWESNIKALIYKK